MRKRLIAVFMSIMVIFALTACGGGGSEEAADSSSDASEVITIKLGHTESDEEHSNHNTICTKFADLVDEYSNGHIQIEVFPNGQLGGERDMVEGMQVGTIDMASTASMVLSNFDPVFYAFDLPYFYPDPESAEKVLDSDFLKQKGDEFASTNGVRILAYGTGGYRYIASNKQITKLADLKGLKIRVPENSVYVDAYNALGCSTTTMAISEVVSGLQQGTVDGFEMYMTPLYTNKFYDLLDNVALTQVNFGVNPLMISENLYKTLSAEDQEILQKAAAEAAAYQREVALGYVDEVQPLLEENGMSINAIEDLDAFEAATAGIKDKYADKIGADVIAEFESIMGN